MNGIGLDDFESEAYDEGEDYGEGGDDTEATYVVDERARQAARRRIAAEVAQRRRARARLGARPSATVRRGPTPRQAVTAIRNVDLDARVREDSLRRAVADQARRANRATYVTVAGVAVDQFFDSFPRAVSNTYLKAGLRFAPLLLLDPQKHGSGVGAFARDPRVIGGALVAGILAFQHGRFFHRTSGVTLSGAALPRGTKTGQLQALRVDTTGNVVPVTTVVWGSLTPAIATVAADGKVTRTKKKATGKATFSAFVDGAIQTVTIDVN